MKRIIEIEENDYELSKADKIPSMGFECRRILIAVRDSKPYEEPRDNFDLGYVKGLEDARPQGEYVDISKLRLMTVEECAGHTIDYAMGWKACIEWIKKGGAE